MIQEYSRELLFENGYRLQKVWNPNDNMRNKFKYGNSLSR